MAAIYLAGVAAALNVGKLPPVLPVLTQALGLTRVDAAFLVSAFQVAGACLGMFGGLLADRFGARRLMVAGLLVLAAAGGAGALASDVASLLAWRALESAGFMLCVLPGPVLMRRVIAARGMSTALGIWGSYMPLGMVIALVVSPWLLQLGDWRIVWWCVALFALGEVMLLCRLVPPDPAGAGAPAGMFALARDTLASPGAWLLSACFGLYAGQWMAVFSFLPLVYHEAAIPPAQAAMLTAIGVLVNLAGNIAAGLLVQRGAARGQLIAVASVAMGVGAFVAFGIDAGFVVRYAALLVLSSVGGLIPGTLFATAPRFAPHAGAVSTTTGLMQQGSSIGQVIAPPLVAGAAGLGGGWANLWWVTCGFAAMNLALSLLVGRLDRRIAG